MLSAQGFKALQPTSVEPKPATYSRGVTPDKPQSEKDAKDIEAINEGRSARSGGINEGLADRQARVKQFVDDILFDTLIGVIIVINAALMGLEVKEKLDGEVTLPYEFLEIMFTVIYMIEISLRLYSY